MFLHHNAQDKLIKRLPKLKLSYENIHKKVSSDIYVLIPKGKKHLVWFTYYEDKKVCIFIELGHGSQRQIRNMFIVPQNFEKKIVLGTIFYGTLFYSNQNRFFSIENIHFYKGKNVEQCNEKTKLSILKTILSNELKQSVMGKHGIYIGLPIMETSFDKSIQVAKMLPYTIYSIQTRDFTSTSNTYNSILYKNTNLHEEDTGVIFAVKADIQNDVYYLYTRNKENLYEKYNIAAIPNYKTSVMMNNIFRKIKENINLDALEESDDEEEFENIEDDKFVDLNKCVKMACIYNNKYNTYVPVNEVSHGNVVCKNELRQKI